MKQLIAPIVLAVIAAVIFCAGVEFGKRAADRYYAEHPVTLIQPLKYRVPATQAQIETPKETK